MKFCKVQVLFRLSGSDETSRAFVLYTRRLPHYMRIYPGEDRERVISVLDYLFRWVWLPMMTSEKRGRYALVIDDKIVWKGEIE